MINDIDPMFPVKVTIPAPTIRQTDFGAKLVQFVEGIKAVGAALVQGFVTLYGHVKKGELIEESGWLPHYTSPFDKIAIEDAKADVAALLERHYKENWLDVKAQFIAKLATYDVDDEAKETFLEALELHEIGHYRPVVRLLFPEIERAARKELFPHWNKSLTSLKELRDAARNSLGLSTFGSIEYSWHLFHQMSEHLYEYVNHDPLSVTKYENDPVPNRHASLHGIIVYKSVNNSLNAIIMTEMMFVIISDLKKKVAEMDEAQE